MRPRLSEEEVVFLLAILKDVEAKMQRQQSSLEEEQQFLTQNVPALKHRFMFEEGHHAYPLWKSEKERLRAVKYN